MNFFLYETKKILFGLKNSFLNIFRFYYFIIIIILKIELLIFINKYFSAMEKNISKDAIKLLKPKLLDVSNGNLNTSNKFMPKFEESKVL